MSREEAAVRAHSKAHSTANNMAFPRNQWNFFLPRNLRLFLVLGSMIWHVLVMGSATEIHLNAKVGENVTFRCPLENRTELNFLYLQKNLSVVNGFHKTHSLPNTWENTWVEKNTKAVHMYNVNVSHAGVYDCVMDYVGNLKERHVTIHLHVTANYSKPEITVLRRDENYWLLKCSSHGGYPRPQTRWNVPESQKIEEENSSDIQDPVTLTFTSSSITKFNCSMGKIEPISCFVDDIESEEISACTPKDPPGFPIHLCVIAAICAVVVPIVAILGAVLWKRKKTRSGAQSEHAMTNGDSGNNEQETPLSDVRGQS